MNKSASIVAAALLGLATAPVAAEGFYGALDVGQTAVADACTGAPGSFGCTDTATLYRFSGGYQFDPMWGAEVSYGDYGKATLITTLADWQLSGLQVSGVATFSGGSPLSLIVKLGVAETTIKLSGGWGELSATSMQFAYGVGAQYELAENVALRAQYEDLGTVGDASTGESKVTLLSGGVIVRF